MIASLALLTLTAAASAVYPESVSAEDDAFSDPREELSLKKAVHFSAEVTGGEGDSYHYRHSESPKTPFRLRSQDFNMFKDLQIIFESVDEALEQARTDVQKLRLSGSSKIASRIKDAIHYAAEGTSAITDRIAQRYDAPAKLRERNMITDYLEMETLYYLSAEINRLVYAGGISSEQELIISFNTLARNFRWRLSLILSVLSGQAAASCCTIA